jgi:DNA-binding SARP family transcriptional activator
MVVISAPSGYGKTVLAAQIASSDCYRRSYWVDASPAGGALRDSVRRLAERVADPRGLPWVEDSEAAFEIASASLAALPDGEPVVVVFDDADWARDVDALLAVSEVVGEAPPGSVAVITTRQEVDGAIRHGRAWLLDATDLLLSDHELADLWRHTLGCDPDQQMVCGLAHDSSGHAALASLLVRRRSIASRDSALGESDPSVSELVKTLTAQLSEGDRHLLDAAATMGSGTIRELARCTQRDVVAEALAHIARVLPLVTLTTAGGDAHFVVHDLVRGAMLSAASLATSDTATLTRIVRHLVNTGALARALHAAVASGAQDVVVTCLGSLGASSVVSDHASAVADALEALPALEVAKNPMLLLLRSQVQWERSELSEAIRVAVLATMIAEHDGDAEMASRARAQVLLWRSATGDFSSVASQALTLLEANGGVSAGESRAATATSGILAAGLLGDRPNLERCLDHARALLDSAQIGGFARARLDTACGVVLSLLDGSWPDAVSAFRRAASRAGVSMCAVASHQNLAGALLEQGMLDEAEASLATVSGSLFQVNDRRVIGCSIASMRGDASDWRAATDAALDQSIAVGDLFTATSLLITAPPVALARRDFSYALVLAERAVSTSVSTGSPVLMWYAELVHAQACLASGDQQRAWSTALRVLPPVEAVGAMGHVLHCRMILAECARADGDLATAVEHLCAVSDYIVDKSPALTVASYLRAFPALLGPLAHAMGVDRIPVRVLRLLPGIYGEEALEQASAVLTPAECGRLALRMRSEAKKVAADAAAADLSDAVCEVHVLGRLEVIAPHGPVADRDWCKRKARLLFAMLVARAGTDVPRGEIIEYLWPEMDEERALNNFYVVWSAMKRALAPNSIREVPCPFVEHVHGVCRIVPGRVVTDLDEFEAHLHAARQARDIGDANAELAAIRAAERVYRGDVLPGDIYDDWFAPVRSRCRHEFEDAMLRAAQILEERGAPHEGLSMLRRPMTNDVLREDFYQAALRLQIAAGQRSAAIETYMSCRSRLVEDLGIDPSRETTALYEQVLGMEDAPV